MLVLAREEVERLFSMEKALEAVRLGAAEYSGGHAEVPRRIQLQVAEAPGEVLVMPGYLPGLPVLGLKVVTGFPGNSALGLHGSPGALLLLNAKTGRVEALLDATYLTDVRTGAMTGVACQYLARAKAEVLGLIGTGAQARTQLDAVAMVRPLRLVRVWSRSPERVARFVAEAALRHPGLEIRGTQGPEEAVCEADVIIAATTATRPVVQDHWVWPGAMVCSVGSHTPEAAELAPEIVARASRVVVDTRLGSLKGSADISGPIAAGLCQEDRVSELGELVLGRAPGRQSDEEITVFKSVGFAAVDLVAAAMVLAEARERGLGQELQLH